MEVSAALVGGGVGVEVTVVVSVGMEVAVRGPTADTKEEEVGTAAGAAAPAIAAADGCRERRTAAVGRETGVAQGERSAAAADGGAAAAGCWRGGYPQTPRLGVIGGRGRGLSGKMPRIMGNCGRHAPADGVRVWVRAVRGRGQVGAERNCPISLAEIGFWGDVGGWRSGGNKKRWRQDAGG